MTQRDGNRARVALCLSGRGYQAMLFQAGCLSRLNHLGWLPRIDCVSAVSGGALAAAALAIGWEGLEFDDRGIASNFEALVVDPLRQLAAETVDEWAILGAACSTLSPGEIIADALDEYLLAGRQLADLPDDTDGEAPSFIFGASAADSGLLVAFSRCGCHDTRDGAPAHAQLRLALAAAASVSLPPWMSTMLPIGSAQRIALIDGSVADSLATEAVPGFCRVLLVSDGDTGAARPAVLSDCTLDSARVVDVISGRLRALRRKEILNAVDRTRGDGSRTVVFWNMSGANSGAGRPSAARPPISTGCAPALHALDPSQQAEMIGWGEAVCGIAVSQWLADNPEPPEHCFQLPRSPISV